jgi:hypothetical protein
LGVELQSVVCEIIAQRWSFVGFSLTSKTVNGSR